MDAGHEEAGGDFDGRSRRWRSDVAGQLFRDECGVGLVLVEGADDVIAVGPGVVAEVVLLVAVAFAEADDVEPVAAPAFAIARGGEEAVDDFLVGGGGGVGQEGGDFLGGRGKAGQVDGHAAEEFELRRRRGGVKLVVFEPGEDEAVDVVGWPCGVVRRGAGTA